MSNDWVADIAQMHEKFGVNDWVTDKINADDWKTLHKYVAFRLTMLDEEMNEIRSAANVEEDAEELVDGLIDLIVFAIGTLDVLEVNANKAWDRVFKANISKTPGVKEGRPNKFGMPDLIKPADWQAPSHEHNHGMIEEIFKNG